MVSGFIGKQFIGTGCQQVQYFCWINTLLPVFFNIKRKKISMIKRIYGIGLVVAQLLLSVGLQGQQTNLPVDEKVKIGKLKNGLTYYIRQNQKPAKRIELRLAVNAGSILENEEQLGLAHFVEHMCFNGTKNFEKNEIIQYLQSIGVKFGPDLNAYTSFDETVYKLTVPSDSAELVDKGFLIMEDWAFNVTFDNEEIDKERGVIIEEWRMGQGPWKRMLDKTLPVIFNGARYAERLPIGKKEIIENFKYETLKKFYKDWYRPDLMALIVVGDIDVDEAEAKIKKHFAGYKGPKEPKKREKYNIPDNKGTLVAIATDKEAPVTLARLLYKDDVTKTETEGDYLNSLKYTFVTGMLNRRLQELTEQAKPPFVGTGFYYGSLFSRNKNGLQGYAILAESGIETGTKALLEETKRMAQFGFTQGEFDRYVLDVLKRYEKSYNERDKTESVRYTDEYVRHFLEEEPIPGIEFEYNFVKNNINSITLEQVNKLASELVTNDNRIIVVNGPEKEGLALPGKEEILAYATEIDNKETEPYVDKLASSELMEDLPETGSISSEKYLEAVDAYELKLSNGATVMLKSTNFKNDEILVTGFAHGGTSLYGQEDHFTGLHISRIMQESGVSEFSRSDLTKLLAGKTVRVNTSIGSYTQNVSASCRPSDVETMFQLLNLKFTKPRIDKEAFDSYINKNRDLYKNLAQEPTNYFYDQYNRIMSQNHPRGNYLPKDEDWDKVDFKRMGEIYTERFADASEFTFVFVGAFNADSLKPLIARYIASLPAKNRNAGHKDLGIRPPQNKVEKKIFKGSDEKSIAIVSFEMETKNGSKDKFLMSQLGAHLGRRYLEELREELSGVYSVRASASISTIPYERATLNITIPCSPDNADSLVAAALKEIVNVQENGVSEKDVKKAKETWRRQKEKNLERNGYWLSSLRNHYLYGNELDKIPSFDNMNKITSKDLQRVAEKYIDLNNYVKVVLYPEGATKKE